MKIMSNSLRNLIPDVFAGFRLIDTKKIFQIATTDLENFLREKEFEKVIKSHRELMDASVKDQNLLPNWKSMMDKVCKKYQESLKSIQESFEQVNKRDFQGADDRTMQ
jgi:Asp-tRNA(Asn)/Glu-tRNA(Gln) amidotransferase C subunit